MREEEGEGKARMRGRTGESEDAGKSEVGCMGVLCELHKEWRMRGENERWSMEITDSAVFDLSVHD